LDRIVVYHVRSQALSQSARSEDGLIRRPSESLRLTNQIEHISFEDLTSKI